MSNAGIDSSPEPTAIDPSHTQALFNLPVPRVAPNRAARRTFNLRPGRSPHAGFRHIRADSDVPEMWGVMP